MTKRFAGLGAAEVTGLRFSTGCLRPNVLTSSVIVGDLVVTATGRHTDDNADKHEEREHQY